jgi:hypothetical protein
MGSLENAFITTAEDAYRNDRTRRLASRALQSMIDTEINVDERGPVEF